MTPQFDSFEAMEAALAIEAKKRGYTLEAIWEPNSPTRRLAVSAPGKLGRGCSYRDGLSRTLGAAYRCMVEAMDQGLPADYAGGN